MKNNQDVLTSAGIADGTPVDTFMSLQGVTTFCCMQDVYGEVPAQEELLYVYATGCMVSVSETMSDRTIETF